MKFVSCSGTWVIKTPIDNDKIDFFGPCGNFYHLPLVASKLEIALINTHGRFIAPCQKKVPSGRGNSNIWHNSAQQLLLLWMLLLQSIFIAFLVPHFVCIFKLLICCSVCFASLCFYLCFVSSRMGNCNSLSCPGLSTWPSPIKMHKSFRPEVWGRGA